MKQLRITLIAILGFGIFLWQALPAYAAGLSTADQQIIQVPLSTWNELKANNEKALTLIRMSRIPLSEVHSLIGKQAIELSDEAERLLERNEQLIRDVERRHQTKQGDGTTTTPPAQHVGAD